MANTIRSRTQVIVEILSLCIQPQLKKTVMYKTNLSWGMLKQYFSFLQSIRLLEAHHSETMYATTNKGRTFIEKWTELSKLL